MCPLLLVGLTGERKKNRFHLFSTEFMCGRLAKCFNTLQSLPVSPASALNTRQLFWIAFYVKPIANSWHPTSDQLIALFFSCCFESYSHFMFSFGHRGDQGLFSVHMSHKLWLSHCKWIQFACLSFSLVSLACQHSRIGGSKRHQWSKVQCKFTKQIQRNHRILSRSIPDCLCSLPALSWILCRCVQHSILQPPIKMSYSGVSHSSRFEVKLAALLLCTVSLFDIVKVCHNVHTLNYVRESSIDIWESGNFHWKRKSVIWLCWRMNWRYMNESYDS